MKKLSAVSITVLLVLAIGGLAFAELKVKTVTSNEGKPEVTKERYATATATIVAVDMDKRIVTLKGKQGRIFDVRADPRIKNLAHLKKGDVVTVKYYEAVSAKVYKPGEAPKVAEESGSLETAKAGEQPAGELKIQKTVTATIESIDMKKPEVTLKTLDGKYVTAKIEDPKLLENVKVGDEVVITYKEAFAISVTKAKKKSAK